MQNKLWMVEIKKNYKCKNTCVMFMLIHSCFYDKNKKQSLKTNHHLFISL